MIERIINRLPAPIIAILAKCPVAGSGVHRFIWRLALLLRPHCEVHVIAEVIRQATMHCGRPVRDREIFDAIKNSGLGEGLSHSTKASGYHLIKKVSKVQRDQALRNQILQNFHGVLETRSDIVTSAEEVVDLLFPGNPLLCVGDSLQTMRTQRREVWRGWLDGLQFIVPSPMTTEYGTNQEGSRSSRCNANTGSRRYLVIEFDSDPHNHQLAFHQYLADKLPLRLVCYSGGKSLHGWYDCAGSGEDRQRFFMDLAVSIGADPATWTRCQPVRLPNGVRKNGATPGIKQTVWGIWT